MSENDVLCLAGELNLTSTLTDYTAEVNTLVADLDAIEVLNGADSVTGSVANAVKTASDALELAISGVDAKAEANADAIEVLTATAGVTGSVDQKIATAVDTINTNVNAKGAVIYASSEPATLGENDLWIAPVAVAGPTGEGPTGDTGPTGE